MKTDVSTLHKEFVSVLEKAEKRENLPPNAEGYAGTTDFMYHVPVPAQRKLAKKWLKEHESLSFEKYIAFLNSLVKGKSHEEKVMVGQMLGYHPRYLRQVTPQHIDVWLNSLSGWEQIDSLCQGTFRGGQVLAGWEDWGTFLDDLSSDKNINKRRASLVLLTRPVQDSSDPELKKKAFAIIERLKHEKDILITKAISWLLRSMVKHHKEEVFTYIADHEETLPKIAVRETTTKIETGTKTGKSQAKGE